MSKKNKKIERLSKKPFFRSDEAKKLGVYPSLLNYYVKKKSVRRIERGLYKGASAPDLDVDFQWEDLILVTKSIPNGVVCLISALALYELTEEIPRTHWIAIPNSARTPQRKNTKIIRLRNFKLGQTYFKIGKEKVRIFDKERVIVDSFRFLGKETAIKALKEGIKKERKRKNKS